MKTIRISANAFNICKLQEILREGERVKSFSQGLATPKISDSNFCCLFHNIKRSLKYIYTYFKEIDGPWKPSRSTEVQSDNYLLLFIHFTMYEIGGSPPLVVSSFPIK